MEQRTLNGLAEIWQTGGNSISLWRRGTGGTISGSQYLKSVMPHLKVVGMDVEGSIIAHYAKTGDAQGRPILLKASVKISFKNYDFKLIDDWIVAQDKAVMTRKLLNHEESMPGKFGAVVACAIRYARTLKTPKEFWPLPDSEIVMLQNL